MLKFTCCPTFSIYSFIFFITMVDIIIYIVSLIVSFTNYGGFNQNQFLGPDVYCLDAFGAENPTKIKCNV